MSPASDQQGMILVHQEVGAELARQLIQAAQSRAKELGVAVAVAVVDRGGQLVALDRMDGTAICGAPIAIDKAFSAVACAAPTDAWAGSTAPGGRDWGMASGLGGRMVVYPGGLPVIANGDVIGGIGVSGAEGHQDKACALFAVADSGLSSGMEA